MVIYYTSEFLTAFEKDYNFIARDNLGAANKFKNELKRQINQIPLMPFSHRKNPKMNDENIRDLICCSRVVSFKIEADKIIILMIFGRNLTKY